MCHALVTVTFSLADWFRTHYICDVTDLFIVFFCFDSQLEWVDFVCMAKSTSPLLFVICFEWHCGHIFALVCVENSRHILPTSVLPCRPRLGLLLIRFSQLTWSPCHYFANSFIGSSVSSVTALSSADLVVVGHHQVLLVVRLYSVVHYLWLTTWTFVHISVITQVSPTLACISYGHWAIAV